MTARYVEYVFFYICGSEEYFDIFLQSSPWAPLLSNVIQKSVPVEAKLNRIHEAPHPSKNRCIAEALAAEQQQRRGIMCAGGTSPKNSRYKNFPPTVRKRICKQPCFRFRGWKRFARYLHLWLPSPICMTGIRAEL